MNTFNGKKILVTGGAGFVGSNLVKILLAQAEPSAIVIVDNFLSAEEFNIPNDPRISIVVGSIADDTVLTKLEDVFDFGFHLATYHGNQSSIFDPMADHANNTLTTLKLMNHFKNSKHLKKLVYSSAGCSVAKKTFRKARATLETDPISLDQDSPYSISKVVGEFYSVYFHRRHGLPTVRARFQNVYGPGEILGAGHWRGTPATVWRNVTPVFIYKALKKLSLPVENKGISTRDFIYVDDICRGLIACALHGTPGDVYNVASGAETSILSLAETINRLTNNSAGIDYRPARGWDHSGKRYGSSDKARKEIGFQTQTSLEDGLKQTIQWTQDNFTFIESCIAKHRTHLASNDGSLDS